jgi:predicted ATPase
MGTHRGAPLNGPSTVLRMPSDPSSTRFPTSGREPSDATTFLPDDLERAIDSGDFGPADPGLARPVEPVAPLTEGEIINGRYRVEACLGQGGMGVVYRVTDSFEDNRPLALKTIRGDLIKPSRIGQFKTEFHTMTFLRHPNVARVFDFERVQDSDDYFFTMELVPGEDALRATEGCGWQDVVEILVQVCRALSYVHSRRLIHYDLKPANVVVDEGKHTKVLDFGIAGRTLVGAHLRGTPQYMAPELSDLETPADHRADLYSLGLMAYELLCRRPPFQASNWSELLQKHYFEQVSFETVKDDVAPPWLRRVVERLCAKQPADRFPTANAVIEAINREGGLAYEPETLETRESYVLSSRFVGRSAEYNRLKEHISQRIQGERQAPPMLLVAGQSGTGKSRLMREVRYHAQLSNIAFCEGRCFEGSFSELAPLVPVLSSLAWIAANRGGSELIDRHMPELAKVSPRLGRRHYTRPSPALPDAGKERTRLREHVIDFVLAVSEIVPFVAFIDDLQWGRRGLTELLHDLVERISIRERLGEPVTLAILGAFRDDEVGGRPLETMLGGLESRSAVEQLPLRRLESGHVGDLVTSMLGIDSLPEAFVQRVANETAGNPFFVEEVMRTLVEEGAVFLRDGVWSARDKVGDIQIPNTVTAVFRRRAEMLDEDQRKLLEAMALCGRPVGVDVLAHTADLESEPLHSALSVLSGRRMALAIPAGEELRYRLSHDRLRETLAADIEPEEGRALHLKIARAMGKVYAEGLEDHLFEITDQYNAAAALIVEPSDRANVVDLNEQAGRMAKLSGAFEASRRYFQFALDFLPADAWTSDYERTAEITRSILEVELFLQDRGRADKHFKLLVTHAKTDLERANAYILKVSALTHAGQAYEALAVTRECLTLLGARMPAHPNSLQVLAQLLRTRLALRGKSNQGLLDQPDMKEGRELAQVVLLSKASAPAMLTFQENLSAYYAAKSVQLTAKYGCASASIMYAMYGFVIGQALGDNAGSRRFAELAIGVAEKYDDPQVLGEATFLVAGFIFPWQYPLSTCMKIHLDGYEASMKAGDLLFAGFHLNVLITQHCMCSESVSATLDLMRKYEEFLVRLNNPHTITEMTALSQMLKLLSGRTVDRLPFDEPGFQEDAFLEYLLEIDDAIPIGFYYTFKLKGLYVMGLYQQAARLVEESERRIPATQGQYVFAEHHFFSFLAQAHDCSEHAGAGKGERGAGARKRLRILERKLRTMRKWAAQCKENFRHKQLLMEAELARIRGEHDRAGPLYEEAFASASEDGFPFNAALSAELGGRFHLKLGQAAEGKALLLQARESYLAWGAGAKVDALDQEFPDLLER